MQACATGMSQRRFDNLFQMASQRSLLHRRLHDIDRTCTPATGIIPNPDRVHGTDFRGATALGRGVAGGCADVEVREQWAGLGRDGLPDVGGKLGCLLALTC